MAKYSIILSTSLTKDLNILLASISSILANRYSDYELNLNIDADLGLAENKKILEDLLDSLKVTHAHFKVLNYKTKMGLPEALNILIGASDCEYVVRADDDDIFLPDRLSDIDSFLQANDVDIGGTGYHIFGNDNTNLLYLAKSEIDPRNIEYQLFFGVPYAHPTIFFSKKAIEKAKQSYDERFRYAQDYKFYVDSFLNGFRFGYLPKPTIAYRSSTSSPERRALQLSSHDLILKHFLNHYKALDFSFAHSFRIDYVTREFLIEPIYSKDKSDEVRSISDTVKHRLMASQLNDAQLRV